jgi:hypothetical protein
MPWSFGSAGAHRLRSAVLGALALGMSLAPASTAHALLTGGPDIISPPASVVDSSAQGGATNNHQQGFNEKQGFLLTAPLATDGSPIPAGTVVNSHMIFLNVPDGAPGVADHGRVWTFDGPILGVISDQNGVKLDASDFLGAPTTVYPGAFPNRGLEGPSDNYSVSGNSITVNMAVTQPGDWIRVITQGQLAVGIDIKPGGEPNCVNSNDRGVIPVAILSSASFDATQVDPGSVRLEGQAIKAVGNGSRLLAHAEDVNGDGRRDLVVQIQDVDGSFAGGSGTATLTGTLLNGVPFRGTDSICYVP